MPRYFFHTENGHLVPDDQGQELANLDAAHAVALDTMGEILRYQGRAFWKTRQFRVIVTDDHQTEVVRLTTCASPAST
ncbi:MULTISPECIES: DUF6894 family protein [unclassified Brevundimonas]|uniref:DUF6894 family protein n=1 Tax=unclassified Brevundimonas TaxID=2622653 RepID=UPI0025C5CD73|nr:MULTISPECIES: hypothetical protein [unclassified Brevundimonas]